MRALVPILALALLATAIPGPVFADAATAAKYQQYGNHYYKQGKYREALQYYEAAQKQNPNPQLESFIQKLRTHLGMPAAGAAPAAQSAAPQAQDQQGTGQGKWRFGGQLLGGFATYGAADLVTSAEHWDASVKAGPAGAEGTATVTQSGPAFGAQLLVESPFGLSLGLGYIMETGISYSQSSKSTTALLPFFSWTTITDGKGDVSTARIPISLIYSYPLSSKFRLGGELGYDLYSASVATSGKSTVTDDLSAIVISEATQTGNFSGSGGGFHIGIDADFAFTPNFIGFMNVGYMMASISGFKGEQDEDDGDGNEPAQLYMLDNSNDNIEGEQLRAYDDDQVDTLPNGYSVRPLNLDMSGLRANLGIRFLFP